MREEKRRENSNFGDQFEFEQNHLRC